MQERTPTDQHEDHGDQVRATAEEARKRREHQEEQIDAQVEDSFPASDPPSTTLVQGVGTPTGDPAAGEDEIEDATHEG